MVPVPLAAALLAGPAAAAEAGATLSTMLRLGTTGCGEAVPSGCPLRDFQDAAVIGPWVEDGDPGRWGARGAVDVRLHGPTALAALDDAAAPEALQPYSFRFRDAWLAAYGEHLDTRIGVDRVAWGVGQGISVVDTLHAWDLSDPTRLDQRLSEPLVDLTAHGGDWALQAVVAPFFVPAALPVADVDLLAGADDVFGRTASGRDDLDIRSLESRVTRPASGWSGGSVGARLRWTPPAADVALSWVHGPDPLPQVAGEVVLTGFQTEADRVDVGVPMRFPARDQLGLELRGTLGDDWTAWGEAAMVFPAATAATVSARQLEALERLGTIDAVPDPLPRTVTQDGVPYARGLAGVGRSVGPVRLSVQYLYGFPTERQWSELRHYALGSARWTPGPAVRVEAAAAVDVAGPGVLADAEIGWLHADTIEFLVGGSHAAGAPGSPLRGFADVSHARIGARVAL